MERYTATAFPSVGMVVDGIYDQCDFRGADLSGRELRGLFFYCDFTGATFAGCTTLDTTLFFECKGLPAWMKQPKIGAKKGELWGEHGKVR